MNAVGLTWQFSRAKQTIDPSEVVAHGAFSPYRLLNSAAALVSCDVINKPVRAEVDADLPQPALEFIPFKSQQRALHCNLNWFLARWITARHAFIST